MFRPGVVVREAKSHFIFLSLMKVLMKAFSLVVKCGTQAPPIGGT